MTVTPVRAASRKCVLGHKKAAAISMPVPPSRGYSLGSMALPHSLLVKAEQFKAGYRRPLLGADCLCPLEVTPVTTLLVVETADSKMLLK